MARENGVTVEKTDEECVIEGFRALVRIATRVVLEELPLSLNSEKREEVPVIPALLSPNQTVENQTLVSADELSEVLSLPRSSIWRLARQGSIPSIRIGRQLRFDKEAVLNSLKTDSA